MPTKHAFPQWHSRGYLPHFDAPLAIQHITYRLSDALPTHAIEQMERAMPLCPDHERESQRRQRIEQLIDAGHGSCILGQESAARVVVETWLKFDGKRYRLLAFVVMPNHCHVLIESLAASPLGKIINSWKSYSARRIREQFPASTPGSPFWQRDDWDRFIRDERHFLQTKAYIENNPMAAALVGATGAMAVEQRCVVVIAVIHCMNRP